MKKQLFLLLVALLAVGTVAQAQTFDFYAASPNGQTLWYKINDDSMSVTVVRPSENGYPNEDSKPAGDLIIPDTVYHGGNAYAVTTMGPECFRFCSGIVALHIPATVTTLQDICFLEMAGLSQITVDPANPVFDSRNNCNALIRTATNSLLIGSASTVIPDNIDTIGSGSFYANAAMTGITIPPSVKYIGQRAFNHSHVTDITFQGDQGSSLHIAGEAFAGCQYLTSLHIPAHVIAMQSGAFADCYHITSITVDPANPFYDSRDNCNAIVVSNTNALKVGCINTTIPTTVTKISVRANIGNHNETNAHIVIPDWVTGFVGDDGLMFGGECGPFAAESIADVTFPAGWQNIERQAVFKIEKFIFKGSTPPVLTDWGGTITGYAGDVRYYRPIEVPCGSLATWQADPVWGYFTNISEASYQLTANAGEHGSVTVVTPPTCDNDTVTVKATPEENCHFTHWSDGSTQNPYTLVLTSDTSLTASFAVNPTVDHSIIFDFYAASPNGQTLWYKINPDSVSVTVVPPSEYGYPSDDMKPAGNLIIPDTVYNSGHIYAVTALRNEAMIACVGITALHIPATMTDINASAGLLGLAGLQYITVDPANPVYDSRNNCNAIIRTATNRLMKGSFYATIPDGIDTIEAHAFRDIPITTITIPPSVRFIDYRAFTVTHLTSVTFQGGPGSMLEIGTEAFAGSQNLTSLHIPAHVMAIDDGAFCDSYNITSITVDPANPIFDSRDNCNAIIVSNTNTLKVGCINTVIPTSVTKICTRANIGNHNETNAHIVIPDWVTGFVGSFGGECGPFAAQSIAEVTFPAGFESIELQLCDKFQKMVFLGSTPPVATYFGSILTGVIGDNWSGWWSEEYYTRPVVVPCGSLATWQADPVWGYFINISEPGVPQLTVNADEHGSAAVVLYPTCGNDTATVSATVEEEHYHFSHWSDGSTENPYTLVLSGNDTLTAHFAIDSVTVSVATSDTTLGATLGGGIVPLNGTATVIATPLGNNIFLCWSNGVTDNPYTLTVTSDTALTAMFTLQDTLVLHDTTIVYDTSYVDVHDTIMIDTTPQVIDYQEFSVSHRAFIPDGVNCSEEGYVSVPLVISDFDGDSIIVSADDVRSVCVNIEHSFMGDVTMFVECPTGQQAVLKYGNPVQYGIPGITLDSAANAIRTLTGHGGGGKLGGYQKQWDNSTDRCDSLYQPFGVGMDYCFSRSAGYILVTGDDASSVWTEAQPYPTGNYYITSGGYVDNMMVYFDTVPSYFLTHVGEYGSAMVNFKRPSNHAMKTDYYLPATTFEELVGCPVNGEWKLKVADTWSVDNGWVFGWSIDIEDLVYHSDTVIVYDTVYVNIHDTTTVDNYIYDTTIVYDTTLLFDTVWLTQYDSIYITLTDTVTNTVYDTVTNTVYDTINNYIYDTVTNTVYDTVTNTIYDTVTNTIYDTTLVTVTDTLWMPGDTVYITLTDTVYIYDTVYVGVDDVEPEPAKIYISGGQIVVEGAEGNAVTLYDVNGRLLATRQDRYTSLRFDVPASGAYLVRIGDRPARRVVVIR